MLPIIWGHGENQAYWGEPHEGFCNAATWMFHLYFSQEACNVEAFRKLRRKDGEWNRTRVLRLFLTAGMNQGGLRMEPLDDWVQHQPINAAEVFAELKNAISETVAA
jgi:hypothetical protein